MSLRRFFFASVLFCTIFTCACATRPQMPDDWMMPRKCVNDRILIAVRNPDAAPETDARLYGYMDGHGKIVIEPRFALAEPFIKGAARVWDATASYTIGIDGEPLPLRFTQWGPDELFTPYQNEKKLWGYRNLFKPGYIFIEPIYDEARPFENGVAAVRSGKKWLEIDIHGKIVRMIEKPAVKGYDMTQKFIPSQAKNGLWGFYEKGGTRYIPAQFDQVSEFSEGLCWVRKGKQEGFINTSGQWAIFPQK